MFFHGSPTKLAPGTTIRPGAQLGLHHDGGDSSYVYMTADTGWSMSQIHPGRSHGLHRRTRICTERRVPLGLRGSETTSRTPVAPLGQIFEDPHYDAGPAACRTTAAQVIAVLDAPVPTHEGPLVELGRQLKALTVVSASAA